MNRLMEFIHKLRERFEEFKTKGKSHSECEHYVSEARRVRTRNRRYDEPGSEPEVTQTRPVHSVQARSS